MEVRLKLALTPAWAQHKMTFDIWVLRELRKAGLPVKGILRFRGVERGALSERIDPVTSELVYVWSEGQ